MQIRRSFAARKCVRSSCSRLRILPPGEIVEQESWAAGHSVGIFRIRSGSSGVSWGVVYLSDQAFDTVAAAGIQIRLDSS